MSEFFAIIKIPATSLLSASIIYVCFLQLKKQGNASKSVNPKVLNRMVFSLLVVLLFPLLLYFIGMASRFWFYTYMREIVISVMIAFPLVVLYNISIKPFQAFLLSLQLERLSLIEQLDLRGETWMALEQNIISEDEAKKAKILRSLRKWIVQGNETGWYEIKEQIVNELTDAQARWFVSKELSLIQQQKSKSGALGRNHNYEERLESLSPEKSVGETWQKLDNNLASEDDAYTVLELYAFKKWAWRNDETGWIDLQYIRDDRKTLSPRVIEFAKFELWEINKKKKKNENFDILKEKRLKDLVFT
jgi:hypothetical protein